MDPCLSHLRKVKHEQPHQRFELGALIPFSIMLRANPLLIGIGKIQWMKIQLDGKNQVRVYLYKLEDVSLLASYYNRSP